MQATAELNALHCWTTTLFYSCWEEHNQEAPSIIELVYQLRDKEQRNIASGIAPKAKSSEGLFESSFDFLNRSHPSLNKLKAFIGRSLQTAIAQANGGVDPRKVLVRVPESWFHITNDGGFHDAHSHGDCSWCGIYYLQVGDQQPESEGAPNGCNRFYSPLRLGGGYNDFGNNYLGHYIDAPLHNGLLLLFPSYLTHSALPYKGDRDRIVIALNARAQLVD